MKQPVERRLAAVLAADVAGYSRLMGADEEGTHERLNALRREVLDPKIAEHHGRIVKTTGDGLLVEFASVVDAVRCAVAMQQAIAERNTGVAVDNRIELRIGINLGDVIVERDDLYGDGVNIAARIEALADAGGVFVSNTVYDQVRDRLAYLFEDLGEQQVKNIARPVRVYRVRDLRPTPSPFEGHTGPSLRTAPAPERGAAPRAALGGSDTPSIAVLPFTNMSGDAEQEYFADGITEDITTALSHLRWLFVIARNSTFTYKGKAVDVRQVALELDVRYILEGSVRTSGGRIRITGQLVDAVTGKHIWAQRYDRELRDIFTVQDEITENVVASIEPHLYEEEGLRAANQPPESIHAWGLVVRAIGLINRVGRHQNEEAQASLQRAIEIEPTYAKAHAVLGWALWWATQAYWCLDSREGHRQAQRHAENALSFDPAEPWGRMVLGLCRSTARHHEQALVELRAALDINPNFALGRTALGWGLLRAGQIEAAIAETVKPLRMSPMDSFAGIYTAIHGLALLAARRFSDALPFLRSSAAFAGYPGHYNALICCCGHLGLLEEAQLFIEARNRVGPPICVSLLRRNLGGFAHCDAFLEGLIKAGVPE
jgi:adenylate cyclase